MATISIADNDARIQHTIGSGGNTANSTQFTIDFPFFSLDDINVIITSSGNDTTLTRGTGSGTFAVVGTSVDDGFSGGYITLGSVYTSVTVTIVRDIAVERTSDFATSGPFNISSLNTDLDKIYAVMQQLETKNDRALTMADSDDANTIQLPNKANRIGTVLAFNATTGDAEPGPSIGSVTTVASQSANINTVAGIASNVTTVSGIASNVTTVAGISGNVTTVAGITSNIAAVVADQADIGVVSTNIASVNTVATNIADVITVANDLNEAVSELETVANDLNEATSEIDTVANSISNVDIVGANIANVNTVGGISANVTTVAGVSANVTTVAGISGNVSTVAGISSDVTSVAGDATDIGTVSTNIANVNIVAGNNSNVSTVAGISGNVTTVAGIQANVTTVAGISGNVTTVANDATDIGTVATNIANVNSVGGSIANVNTVASNLASVNNFGEVYRIANAAPTSSLNSGDLYFNTSTNVLNVYGASGWQNAGSSINGTSQRYHYDITSAVTSVTGADANGNTLAYDAGYVDVYVNGVRMSTADVTVTSGDTVAFTSALANGDEVDIVGYGTFAVASLNADNLDSGTVPDARITGAYTGITNLTMSGNLTVDTSTLYVDSTNNRVGVGTVSPSKPLHVFNSGTSYVQISGNSRDLFLGQDATGGAIFSTGAVPMYFSTNSTERMRVHSGGNVTIGTTDQSPAENSTTTGIRLGNNGGTQISTTSGTTLMLNRNTSDGTLINFRRAGAEVGAIQSFSGCLAIGSYVGNDAFIRFGNSDVRPVNSSGTDRNGAISLGSSTARFNDLYISGGIDISDGNITSNVTHTFKMHGGTGTGGNANYATYSFVGDSNTGMFSGTADTLKFATGGSERMRIHSGGATSFGTSDASPYVGTEGFVVALNNGVRYGAIFGCDNAANREAVLFVNPNGAVGSIKTHSSSTSYNTSSDYRLKNNVTADWDATTRLKQLNPVRFNFITDADTTVDGFLAHEVQSVVPEAITGTHNEVDADGNPVYQQIDQSKIVPLLVKTIQELEARIVALENA